MIKTTSILEWISFRNQQQQTINLLHVVRSDFVEHEFRVNFCFEGQDVHAIAFKLFPPRADSVDNGNRASPTNNVLQRVKTNDFHRLIASFFLVDRIFLSKTLPTIIQTSKSSIFSPFQVLRFVCSARRRTAVHRERNCRRPTKFDENERRNSMNKPTDRKLNDEKVIWTWNNKNCPIKTRNPREITHRNCRPTIVKSDFHRFHQHKVILVRIPIIHPNHPIFQLLIPNKLK